jgi:hypothetical protein
MHYGFRGSVTVALALTLFAFGAAAQVGNSGSIQGVVSDSSGGAVANATVEIIDVVSGCASGRVRR